MSVLFREHHIDIIDFNIDFILYKISKISKINNSYLQKLSLSNNLNNNINNNLNYFVEKHNDSNNNPQFINDNDFINYSEVILHSSCFI